MVKIEEIEDFFKKETEKIDKEFLERLSKVKNKDEKKKIEAGYEGKNETLIKEYEKKITGYLREQKKAMKEQEKKKIAKKSKKGDFKYFVVKKIDLRDTWKDKIKLKWELFKFKNKIKSKNFRDEHVPELVKIYMIKSRMSLKKILSLISKIISEIFSSMKTLIFNISIRLKNAALLIFAKLKILIKWLITKISIIFSKIFKKKKTEESKEKRPDEEIAERLLKKDKEKK